METTVCCPPFDPQPWNETTHIWADKPFLKDEMVQFLHLPFPGAMSRAITRMWDVANNHEAAPDTSDFLLLAYDPSPWKCELYLSLTKDIPGEQNGIKLTGNFISKVYDGPYNHVPRFLKDMEAYLKKLGKTSKRHYFYYTTCPKCARKYGHNYIVLLAEV